ncbi:hypothetical protein [Rhizobium leucaenae]|uniref:hypothetical protein n=1 Tax=Rhizobium leucaenae TaxID=29450 RepID=UPI0003F7C90F|nr:hypothetical protein [Rhizobium leucaenae]
MKPKLVRKPGRVLAWSLSMWCVYIAGLLQIVPYIVPYLDGYIPHWASLVALLASPFGAIIYQGNLHADK